MIGRTAALDVKVNNVRSESNRFLELNRQLAEPGAP
jgi:hypothetical protein